jgi:CBS domain containing-hemolysin-like protein
MRFIVGLLLAGLTLLAVSLQRTYHHVPVRELKRRARAHDELAALLYKAVAYGYTLRAVLWFLIGITSAAFFVYVTRTEPAWFALVASGALVWIGFVWLPARQVSRLSERLAARVAPVLAGLLYYLHPVVERLITFIRRHYPLHIHTGLYEKADLLELLERQQVQPDNRIEAAELEIAHNALSVGDVLVRDVLTPKRVVKTVNIEDAIGPVLMDELHASGFSRFPVYEGKKDHIVGTLFLRDLVRKKTGGLVKNTMRPEVCFIHEEQSLVEALQAILKTRHHLFIVVNSFEEYVGVISIEDVLSAIVGKPILDEFDQYDDLRAVAAYHARTEHREHIENTPTTAPEVIE